MTGHFTTADGCERWIQMSDAPHFYRIPITRRVKWNENYPFSTPRRVYMSRNYELVRIEPERGLAHYEEVA